MRLAIQTVAPPSEATIGPWVPCRSDTDFDRRPEVGRSVSSPARCRRWSNPDEGDLG